MKIASGVIEPGIFTRGVENATTCTPEVRTFGRLAFIRSGSRLTALHSLNLEVGVVDPLVWRELDSSTAPSATRSEILEELNGWSSDSSALTGDQHLAQKVQSLNINLTQICNLKCSYCAAGGDGTFGNPIKKIDLSKTMLQLDFFFARLEPGDHFHIKFFGGEPLLYPDAMVQLADAARELAAPKKIDLLFSVITNGTLVNAKTAQILADLRAEVTVSIDGPEDINDRQRPNKSGRGSTAQTLKGLQELVRFKSQLASLKTSSVFGRHFTGVRRTWEFLRAYPIDQMNFEFAAEIGDQNASREYIDELCQVGEIAFALGGESELRRISQFAAFFEILDQRKRIWNHCGAGKTLMQVDAQNRLSGCPWFVGKPEESLGTQTHLNQKNLDSYAKPLAENTNCHTCWARFVCGGGCLHANKIKTGSKRQLDPEFCDRMQKSLAKGVELYGQSRQQNDQGGSREVC